MFAPVFTWTWNKGRSDHKWNR